MKKIFVFSIIFLFLFNVVIVSSQQLVPTTPLDNENFEAQQQYREEVQFGRTIFWIVDIVVLISLAIVTIFIVKNMMKKNFRVLNLIIHGMIMLGSLVLSIVLVGATLECLNFPSRCNQEFYVYLLSIPTFLFSLIINWKLIKKRYCNYSANLCSGALIFVLLGVISSFIVAIIIRPKYDPEFALVFPILGFLTLIILYPLLAIIGLILDRRKK